MVNNNLWLGIISLNSFSKKPYVPVKIYRNLESPIPKSQASSTRFLF